MKILKYILSFFRAKKTKETKDTSIHIPNGLLNHFRYEDESGETMGCGCDICLARHAKYNAEKRLDALEYKTLKIKEIRKYFEKNKHKTKDIERVPLLVKHSNLMHYIFIKNQRLDSIIWALKHKYKNDVYIFDRRYKFLLTKCNLIS